MHRFVSLLFDNVAPIGRRSFDSYYHSTSSSSFSPLAIFIYTPCWKDTQSDPLRLFDPWGCRTTTSEGQFNYNGLRFQGRRRRTPFGSTANPANLILPQLVLRTDSPYNIQHLSAGRTSRATASAISCRHGRGSSIIIFDPTLPNIY